MHKAAKVAPSIAASHRVRFLGGAFSEEGRGEGTGVPRAHGGGYAPTPWRARDVLGLHDDGAVREGGSFRSTSHFEEDVHGGAHGRALRVCAISGPIRRSRRHQPSQFHLSFQNPSS